MKMNMAKIPTTNSVAAKYEPPRFRSKMIRIGSNGFAERISTTTNTARRTTPTAISVSVAVAVQPSVTALVNP